MMSTSTDPAVTNGAALNGSTSNGSPAKGAANSSHADGVHADGGAAPTPIENIENQEWLESLDYVFQNAGPDRVAALLERLETHAHKLGVSIPFSANTPYINTILPEEEPDYPGDLELERTIRNLVRWNAMAMVVRAGKASDGVGGHISTFASSATLYEVAQNHFFKGKDNPDGGDQIFFQGHASPGMYTRAFFGSDSRAVVIVSAEEAERRPSQHRATAHAQRRSGRADMRADAPKLETPPTKSQEKN